MTYRGRVKNGRITLDESVPLPEGAEVQVAVVVDGAGRLVRDRRHRRIRPDPDLAREIALSAEFVPDEA